MEISIGVTHAFAKSEKFSTEFALSRKNKRLRNQRAVTRPHVGIGVARKMRDVVIVCRNDGAAIVNLRARDQQAARLQLLQMFWKRIGARKFLLRPQAPIGLGAIQHALRSFVADLLVQRMHFVVTFSSRDPVHACLTAVGSKRKLESNRAVHAALRNAVAA